MMAVSLTSVTRKRTENVWRCGVSSRAIKGPRVTPTTGTTIPAALAPRLASTPSGPPIPTAETTAPPALDLRSARRLMWNRVAPGLQYSSQSSDRSCFVRLSLGFMVYPPFSAHPEGEHLSMKQLAPSPPILAGATTRERLFTKDR